MSAVATLGLGLLLGLRHATDPDHVVAVTTIASRTRRVLPAMWLGVVWGLGHTSTLFVVGGAIILFGFTVPPRLGLAAELCVALALVAVGLLNFGRHAGAHSSQDRARPPVGRTFIVGLVHGLAGSAAVALLVVANVRDPLWACGYLLVFGFGTLIGMALVASGFALPVVVAAERWLGAGRLIRVSTGTISLVFGAWLVYQIGWRDGLFLATASWSPH